MVVLLIIAILLAIAIPTFLGVSGSANDRAAQSNLTNALTEVKALYQNNQSYNSSAGTLPAATRPASVPEFSWSQAAACTAASGTNCVSEYPVDVVNGADGAGVVLAARSKTGTCWYAVDLEAAPTTAALFNSGAADSGTGFTVQFLSSTSAAHAQEAVGGAALTTAGVYYAKTTSGTCNATNPTYCRLAWLAVGDVVLERSDFVGSGARRDNPAQGSCTVAPASAGATVVLLARVTVRRRVAGGPPQCRTDRHVLLRPERPAAITSRISAPTSSSRSRSASRSASTT